MSFRNTFDQNLRGLPFGRPFFVPQPHPFPKAVQVITRPPEVTILFPSFLVPA